MTDGIVDEKSTEHDDERKELARMKANVERATSYWKQNNNRYNKFRKFCFKTAITTSDESALNQAGRPILEFNIVNAPISRQCGEFSKQEPSIEVSAKAGKKVDPKVIEFIDGHLRYILDEAKKRNVQYNIYRNTMSGGFSNFKVVTEYEDEMSFDQVMRLKMPYNDVLTGYDPMAKEVDKSDADWYFEVFLMDKKQFEKENKDVPLDQLSFIKFDGIFNWSFKNQDQYVVVLVDYYEKIKTKKNIVKLANNETMLKSDYKKELEKWEKEGHIEQPPEIIDEREAEFINIKRSRIMQTKILEEKDTLFKHNNIVFVDGDSVLIQDDDNSNVEQFTKPYIYHTEGLQRLVNFSGQVIANDFENMVQSKYMIAEEALPTQEDALEGWKSPQKADLLIHRAYSDVNPEQQLPIPQTVNRIPLPPEILTTFNSGMQILQNILGSYDASLGQNEQQISGVAIVEAATLSNGSAMPYIINYMQSLTSVANCIVDLIPKLNKSARELAIIGKDGKKDKVKVNQEGGIPLNYDSSHIQVNIEAGVNFSIAKNKALQQLTLLMKISPEFAEFMNSVGLETLLDNMEFRNVDLLRSKVEEWKIQKEQQKQNQPNPEMIKAQMMQQQLKLQEDELKLKGEELSAKTSLDTERLIIDKQKADNDRLEMMVKMGESKDKVEIAVAKANAEEERARADLGLKAHHQSHTQFKELAEVAIKHNSSTEKNKEI